MTLPTIFNRISLLDQLTFTKHLAIMVKSGIPLPEAVKSLSDQTRNPNFKKVLAEILADIENGQSLEKALFLS